MNENEILTRLFLAIALILGGLAAYWLANRMILLRARRAQPNLPAFRPGTAAILYFTTPECVACKTVQRPALQRLAEKMGSQLRVIEVNAQEQPDMASQWGVLSVPTTFILDPKGQPRHVNHGVTRAEKLQEQLASLL
jgi:thiol-disulfide isomerase/thioredoxin